MSVSKTESPFGDVQKTYLRGTVNAAQQTSKPVAQSAVKHSTASTDSRDRTQIEEKEKARSGDRDVLLLYLSRKSDKDRVEKRTHSEPQRESKQTQPRRARPVPEEPKRVHRQQPADQRPKIQNLEPLTAPEESARKQAAERIS